MNHCRLCACRLGFTLGLIWGVSAMALGLSAHWFNYGSEIVHLLGTVYIGYKATVLGSIFGLVWGFVDCFVFGFLIGIIYNATLKKGKCCQKKS